MIRLMRRFLLCLVTALLPLFAVAQNAPSAREALPFGMNWDMDAKQIADTLRAKGGRDIVTEAKIDPTMRGKGKWVSATAVPIGGMTSSRASANLLDDGRFWSITIQFKGTRDKVASTVLELVGPLAIRYGQPAVRDDAKQVFGWRLAEGTTYETIITVKPYPDGTVVLAYGNVPRGANEISKMQKGASDF